MNRSTLAALLSSPALLAACGDDPRVGTGQLVFTVTGEEAALEGFPIEEDGVSIGFADGYAPVRFSRVLVSLGNLRAATSSGNVGVDDKRIHVVDLARGEQTLATFDDLAAWRWDRIGFDTVVPSGTDLKLGEGVAAQDVEAMTAGGYAMWLEGTAVKSGRTFTFRFGLANATRHDDCTNGEDEKAGVVVPPSGSATASLTFHLEHLFFDALGSENAQLRFEAMAGAAGTDDAITSDDLASVPLAGARGVDGAVITREDGSPLAYDPGATPLTEANLRGFVNASTASMGHLNGGGLCTLKK